MGKLTPMKAIRKKCLDCSGTSNEVKLCNIESCPLFIYRSGHRPKEYSDIDEDILDDSEEYEDDFDSAPDDCPKHRGGDED